MAEMYTCKFCGTEIDWEGADDNKGSIWSCEELGCDEMFCQQCFVDKYGSEHFLHNVNAEDIVRCPNCYEKHLKKEN